MHLLPDHDRVGLNPRSALPPVGWREEAPIPALAPQAVWYPPRARASVERRTPAEQERENLERTAVRKEWDTYRLVQAGEYPSVSFPAETSAHPPTSAMAALLGVAIDEAGNITAEERRYLLHHYRTCERLQADSQWLLLPS